MSVSYSQLGQDVDVIEFYKYKKNGYFVDIGAYDGVDLSNTYVLETNFSWKGICVEPMPSEFSKLVLNRSKSICEQKVVYSTSDLSLPFDIANNLTMLSGLTDTMNCHKSFVEANKTTIQVTSISLQDLLEKHNAPNFIEYLSLDAAGSEWSILSSFDFRNYAFGLIHVQHNFIEPARSSIRTLLQSNGYEFIKENKWDDCYKHSTVSLHIHRENCCPVLFPILNSMKSPKGKIAVRHRLDNNSSICPDTFQIFISSEPENPKHNEDMFILPFRSEHPKSIYYPFLYMALAEMRTKSFARVAKTEFCAFLYFKDYPHRVNIFKNIQAFKHVHALGKSCNNTQINVTRNIYSNEETFYDIAVQLYSRFKFVLAVENCWKDGYFTEKIILPMFAHSIPLYWGHPSVFEYINKKRVIYLPDYPTLHYLFQLLKRLLANESEYENILKEPWFVEKGKPEVVENEFIQKTQDFLLHGVNTENAENPKKAENAKKEDGPIHLITSFYISTLQDVKNEIRNKELIQSLQKNIDSPYIQSIHLFVDDQASFHRLSPFLASNKIVLASVGKGQPSFKDFFAYAFQALENKICMISNSDIYIDSCELPVIHKLGKDQVYALSRHEHNFAAPVITNYCGSHDSYLFQSPLSIDLEQFQFIQNVWGSDNKMCCSLYSQNIQIFNPCYQIRIVHLHSSGIRNPDREILHSHNLNDKTVHFPPIFL